MAFMVDHPRSNFKHFCKICKKGFMCGRALGGHMRAHGIGYESIHMDDDDDVDDDDEPVSDWEDNKNSSEHNPRRMYALRANPNRLKNCRVCQNCGKEFLSWKSFLEHGKCRSEDAESLLSSHESYDEDGSARRGWSKRKRSLRVDVDNVNASNVVNKEEDLANCLVMLSKARVDHPLAPLAPFPSTTNNIDKAKGVARGLFECKACKKVFNSHQALGGHRASHKKVKGCFAARLDQVDDYVPDDDVITQEELFPTMQKLQDHHGSSYANSKRNKTKVHECSICHRVFSSGQALGGHKRCHWITSNSPDTASLAKLQQFHDYLEQLQQSHQPPNNTKFHSSSDPLDLKLDLNIPVPLTETMANPIPLQTGLELSTRVYLQSWLGMDAKEREVHSQQVHHQQIQIDKEESSSKKNGDNSKNIYAQKINDQMNNVEDEGHSKVKLAKLSKLKDMNLSGEGSSWLQVGIGSASTDHCCHASTSK